MDGTDDNGDPILRRQTLTVLDTADDTGLSNFLDKLGVCLDSTIYEAFKIDYTQLV